MKPVIFATNLRSEEVREKASFSSETSMKSATGLICLTNLKLTSFRDTLTIPS